MTKKRYEIVATAYDKRGRVICSSLNSYKDSSSLMRYYAMKVGKFYSKWNHAEVSCISKATKMHKKIDKLVILRYDCYGNLRNAKPCTICSACINDFNIKEVYYSTNEGKMERL